MAERFGPNAVLASLLHVDLRGGFMRTTFRLITPLGAVFSKDQYLNAVEAGALKYSVMELDSPVDVRVYGAVALIRYRMQIEIDVQGQKYPGTGYWFTDAYERRDGRWQIV
jgi:hypothetical protein